MSINRYRKLLNNYCVGRIRDGKPCYQCKLDGKALCIDEDLYRGSYASIKALSKKMRKALEDEDFMNEMLHYNNGVI